MFSRGERSVLMYAIIVGNLLEILSLVRIVLVIGTTIMNLSITTMEIVVVWGRFWIFGGRPY
jgi:hypothetical protein